MKADIHPLFYEDAQVKCACGEVWTVGSTVRETAVETCGKCHPFWTGEQRIVDTEGRVERFLKRYNLNADDGGAAAAVVKPKPQAKAAPSDNAKNGEAGSAKSAENGKNASAKDDKSDKNAESKNSKQQQSGDAPQDAA